MSADLDDDTEVISPSILRILDTIETLSHYKGSIAGAVDRLAIPLLTLDEYYRLCELHAYITEQVVEEVRNIYNSETLRLPDYEAFLRNLLDN